MASIPTLFAIRNSSKSKGNIWTFIILPIGIDETPFKWTPSNEPEAIYVYLPFVLKNFKRVINSGYSCISSIKTRVSSWSTNLPPATILRWRRKSSTVVTFLNNSGPLASSIMFISTKFLNSFFPTSLIMKVFPIWRAPYISRIESVWDARWFSIRFDIFLYNIQLFLQEWLSIYKLYHIIWLFL